jgi:hypothetical protein
VPIREPYLRQVDRAQRIVVVDHLEDLELVRPRGAAKKGPR